MPLQKTDVTINFGRGLDTKTDPWQLQSGKFLQLSNSVFTVLGQLKKRNGYMTLPQIQGSASFLATYADNLVAVGTNNNIILAETGAHSQNLWSYSGSLGAWVNSGGYQPLSLSVQSILKNGYSQTAVDQAFAPNGLVCTVYSSGEPFGAPYKYLITDSLTGIIVTQPQSILCSFSPRAFCVGPNFVIAYDSKNEAVTAASSYSLLLKTIQSQAPSSLGSTTTVSSSCHLGTKWKRPAFDGVVSSNTLYLAFTAFSSGVSMASVGLQNQVSTVRPIASTSAQVFGLAADTTSSNSFVYVGMTNGSGSAQGLVDGRNIRFACVDANVVPVYSISSVTTTGSGFGILNINATASRGAAVYNFESGRNYAYDANLQTNLINQMTVSSSGLTFPETALFRSLGIASKGFSVNSLSYFLGSYQSPASGYQNSYFLANNSGGIVARLAYGNGFGYITSSLPSVYVQGQTATMPYLYQELITPVPKLTNATAETQTTGVFSGTFGINDVSFTFNTSETTTKELGSNLCLNGGFLWSYDGNKPAENNFFIYPDGVEASVQMNTGFMSPPQTYFYQVTYEWQDNQGNIFRSSPSIPIQATLGSGSSAVALDLPLLRLTDKPGPVTIGVYRWSVAQPIYYKVTPNIAIDAAALTNDYVVLTDTKADASIIGGEILYTNGGEVEDSAGPACLGMCEFDSRLWLIDAEDPNLLWFSKQILEATPVEMSDLFTYFVSPTAGAAGPTGPVQAIAHMDDKLIIFKDSSIFYVSGTGPDNTGANNQYSPSPIFITGTLGCTNQNSIVLTSMGLMFQSDKGIWLLGRDLSTQYVGKDVESYNSNTVLSAQVIPGTNQVRFTLNNGLQLMYDYFVGQWGTFSGPSGASGTLQNSLQTLLTPSGQVVQESVGSYSDLSQAVTLGFQTNWINLVGLEGYERAYKLYILGQFLSPHTYSVGVAYNYNPAITQTALISPTNSIGSGSQVEQWEIGFQQQQCQSFQLTFTEVSSQSSGAGLTLSGMNIVYGVSKGYPRDIGVSNKTG